MCPRGRSKSKRFLRNSAKCKRFVKNVTILRSAHLGKPLSRHMPILTDNWQRLYNMLENIEFWFSGDREKMERTHCVQTLPKHIQAVSCQRRDLYLQPHGIMLIFNRALLPLQVRAFSSGVNSCTLPSLLLFQVKNGNLRKLRRLEKSPRDRRRKFARNGFIR